MSHPGVIPGLHECTAIARALHYYGLDHSGDLHMSTITIKDGTTIYKTT